RPAAVVAEDRGLAVLPLACMTAVAATQPAGEVEPPVPAARGLEQVAADRAGVPELRRGGRGAGLAQDGRDLRVGLELGERGAGTDRGPRRTAGDSPRWGLSPASDAPRDDVAQVDGRVRLDEPLPEQQHEVGAAGETDAPVAH